MPVRTKAHPPHDPDPGNEGASMHHPIAIFASIVAMVLAPALVTVGPRSPMNYDYDED